MGFKIFLQLVVVFLAAFLVNASPDSAGSEARATCNRNCGSTSEPMCANNGITYANSCRFNCAKAHNRRLKFVKSGSCAGTSLKEYRGSAARPDPNPSRYPATTPARYPATPPPSSSNIISGWRSLFRF